MNIKLLRKVAAYILAEPKRLDMNTLGEQRKGRGAPPCKTAACIAGWSCVLGAPKAEVTFNDCRDLEVNGRNNLWFYGQELLRLNPIEADTLFREPSHARTTLDGTRIGWPEKFANAYVKARSAKQRAKVTVARINHFIATDGRE